MSHCGLYVWCFELVGVPSWCSENLNRTIVEWLLSLYLYPSLTHTHTHEPSGTGSRVEVIVPWYQITGRVVNDTLVRVISHDELDRGDVIEWTKDITENMSITLETQYAVCANCKAKHDSHSRNCVACGTSYCRTCKKDMMVKLESKKWRCNTCQAGFIKRSDSSDERVTHRKSMFNMMLEPFKVRSWLSLRGGKDENISADNVFVVEYQSKQHKVTIREYTIGGVKRAIYNQLGMLRPEHQQLHRHDGEELNYDKHLKKLLDRSEKDQSKQSNVMIVLKQRKCMSCGT